MADFLVFANFEVLHPDALYIRYPHFLKQFFTAYMFYQLINIYFMVFPFWKSFFK